MEQPSNKYHFFDDESKIFNPSQKLAESDLPPLPKPEPEKPKVDMSVPRSSKPIHRVIPLFLIVASLFFFAVFISNMICNFGRSIEPEKASEHALGIVGYWVSYFFFGEFGAGAFLYPVLLLNLAIRWKKYIDKKNAIEKCIFSVFTPFFLSMLLQVFVYDAETTYTRDVMRTDGWSLQGGGVAGGWLGNQLVAAVNKVGAAVILIICLIGLVFYLVGVTPQYLAQHSRIKKDIHDEKHALEEEDKEEKANIERDKKLQKKLRKERAEQRNGQPSNNVGNSLMVVSSSGKDKLAPMPMPNLLVHDTDDLYIPDDVKRGLSEKEEQPTEKEIAETAEENTNDAPDEIFPLEKKKEKKSEGFDLSDVFGESDSAEQKKKKTDPLIAFYEEQAKKEAELQQQRAEAGEPTTPAFIFSDTKKPSAPVGYNGPDDVTTNGKIDIFKAMGGGRRPSATESVIPPRNYGENPLDGVAPVQTNENEPYAPPQPIFQPFIPLPKSEDEAGKEQAPKNIFASEPVTEHDEGEMVHHDDTPKDFFDVLSDNEDEDSEEYLDDVQETLTEKEQEAEAEEEEEEVDLTAERKYDQMSLADVLEEKERQEEILKEQRSQDESMMVNKQDRFSSYVFPPINYLHDREPVSDAYVKEIAENQDKLYRTLNSFKINVDSIRHSNGPTITRYEVTPSLGTSVKGFIAHESDIALALAVKDIRIESPIDGLSAVGIEVPKKNKAIVYLRELLESAEFVNAASPLTCCLGVDVTGKPMYIDLEKMPHLLVAGATGMGKSVCINSLIMSLLYKASYNDVKLMLIDPKKVEFTRYKNIPHLAIPIITNSKDAAGALNAAVEEMERRYDLLTEEGVVNADAYNIATKDDPEKPYIPKLVIIIDELADLMLTAREQVETSISRLLAKARAAGIHLIVATQRPSVDVITGLLKANLNSRIALPVASNVDSKCILDHGGAEKLAGKGDMLFHPIGAMHDIRVQGTFVANEEVEKVCDFIRNTNGPAKYSEALMEKIKVLAENIGAKPKKTNDSSDDYAMMAKDPNLAKESAKKTDAELYKEAVKLAVTEARISTSLLERKFGLGYGRAAKMLDKMQEDGIISGPGTSNARPRQILISYEEYLARFENQDGEQEENG